jgi:hypothetical protein
MKTRNKLLGLIAIAIITIGIIGCKGDEPTDTNDDNVVKERSATITLFEGKTATVKGEFDKAGLDSVADKIKTELNNIFNLVSDDEKNILRTVFSRGVTFIVEKNTEYYYKLIGDGKTVYFNLDAIKDENVLLTNKSKICDAVFGMNDNLTGTDYFSLPPQKQPDTPRTLTFPTTENPNNTYSVTITSEEQFTAAEWKTHCDNVVTALETAYGNGNGASKSRFRGVFGQEGGIKIVLEKNPTDYTNYKVGTDFQTLYLNVDNIASINYGSAIAAMAAKDPNEPLNKD